LNYTNASPDSPRPNPSLQGENPENTLYAAWKNSKDSSTRSLVEAELLPYLRRHAAKVCWIVLHSYQPHLTEEIAQDAILELKRFEERSLFSTWFHARAYFRTRLELRKLRLRKEQSLDSGGVVNLVAGTRSIDSAILVEDILSKLTEEEREFVNLKVNFGLTDEELSEELGMSRSWVQNTWAELRSKLKTLYGRNSR